MQPFDEVEFRLWFLVLALGLAAVAGAAWCVRGWVDGDANVPGVVLTVVAAILSRREMRSLRRRRRSGRIL